MDLKNLEQIEVRFSGSGGQGLVLASIIFADILTASGYNVIQGESHGIEARGGASRGEVIASKQEITDLSVKKPDIYVALSQSSLDKYYQDIKQDSLVIVDSFLINNFPDIQSNNLYKIPFTSKAKEVLGSTIPTNIMFLGAISELTNLAEETVYQTAIKQRIPANTEDMNLQAFSLGMELAKKAKEDRE